MFAVTQLGKMLLLATFIPDAGEGVGLVFQVLRTIVAGIDLAGVFLAFRWGTRG
jgi:hypothetical protein